MKTLNNLEVINYNVLTLEQKEEFKTIKSLPNCIHLVCIYNKLTRLPKLPKM